MHLRPRSFTHTHTHTHLLGDVGRRRHVDDGLESGGVGRQLVVQTVLHHHGDGSDLIPELAVVLTENDRSAVAGKHVEEFSALVSPSGRRPAPRRLGLCRCSPPCSWSTERSDRAGTELAWWPPSASDGPTGGRHGNLPANQRGGQRF